MYRELQFAPRFEHLRSYLGETFGYMFRAPECNPPPTVTDILEGIQSRFVEYPATFDPLACSVRPVPAKKAYYGNFVFRFHLKSTLDTFIQEYREAELATKEPVVAQECIICAAELIQPGAYTCIQHLTFDPNDYWPEYVESQHQKRAWNLQKLDNFLNSPIPAQFYLEVREGGNTISIAFQRWV